DRYGTDRPDLRFDMPLVDLSATCEGSGFAPIESALSGAGAVRGLRVAGAAASSRKKLDEWGEEAKKLGAAGLLWIKRTGGEVSSPAKKGLAPGVLERIVETAGVEENDLLLIVAGTADVSAAALGALRVSIAREMKWIDESRWAFCWVTDFPLVGRDAETGTWYPMNHPFTS